MNSVKVITPVATELLTAAEVKAFLKIDHTDEDDLIATLITAARLMIQEWCGIAIGEQTLQWFIDFTPKRSYAGAYVTPTYEEAKRNMDYCGGSIEGKEFPYYPLISLTSVYSQDSEYDYNVSTDYKIQDNYFLPNNSGRWRVTYHAGYRSDDQVDDLPVALKLIWLQLISYLYTNRQEEEVTMPSFIKYALNPYKRSLI